MKIKERDTVFIYFCEIC